MWLNVLLGGAPNWELGRPATAAACAAAAA